MQYHQLANLFPMMEGQDLQDLADSIKNSGLRDPIITYQDAILDGRNRYEACKLAGIDPKFKPFDGDDAMQFVIDHNLRRRHLNDTQRAAIAAKLANIKWAMRKPHEGSNEPSVKQSEAAQRLNVSKASVKRAAAVYNGGTKEEIQAMEEGRAGVTTLSDKVRARRRKEPEKSKKIKGGWSAERRQQEDINLEIWGHVRGAIEHLTSLPLAIEVVPVIKRYDRGGLVERKLARAVSYIKEMEHAWNTQNSDHNNHATNGGGVIGEKQAKSAA